MRPARRNERLGWLDSRQLFFLAPSNSPMPEAMQINADMVTQPLVTLGEA